MTIPGEPEFSHLAMRSRFGEIPVGAAVTLYEGPLVIRDQSETRTGHGKAWFEFVPDLSLRFAMETTEVTPASSAEVTIDMVSVGSTAHIMVLNKSQSSSDAGTVDGILAGKIQFTTLKTDDSPEPIGRVQFHVLNFRGCFGEKLWNKSGWWAGRTRFKFGEWVVTLDSLPNMKERREQIEAKGGYAITHLGDLRCQDQKLFEQQEASNVLEFLYWFLSFANGARCGCVLSSGFRHLDQPLWEDWTEPVARSGKDSQSWFALLLPDKCLATADKFYSLWCQKEKREWLELAVGIYTDTNDNKSGTELELIKAQVALELLCWVVLREDNAVLSEEGLEKLSAADRVRLLLSWCGIPLPIPASVTELVKAGVDGPQVVTEIRNSVVHPTKKNRNKLHEFSRDAKFEAWQLSMWYVELVMLKLFGYTGRYDNRLDWNGRKGTYERVPWARQIR